MLPNRLRKPIELSEDKMSYATFHALIEAFEDKWNDIINMIIQYERGEKKFHDSIPLILRNMSVLGQEMDRVSTREVLNDDVTFRAREENNEW